MSLNTNNGFEALLAQANECLKRAGEALNLAVEGMPPAGDFQNNYIRQQATSVASVALDVNLLVNHGRFENVVGLCRIGFESRINLYAAMRVPEFAAQKYLAGAKGHVEELEELAKENAASPLFRRELENHKRLLDDLRRDLGGIEEKPWCKFKEVVKAAGLMPDYEAHYPTMSKAVHNTMTGLAAKTDDRILIRSVLNLLNDAVETCAVLVFFQIPGKRDPRPLTTKWKEVAGLISTFQDEYGGLAKRLNELTNETFRHPEN
jgi:hypothetical protein